MNCTALYDPNPDIAGIGIILSLVIHAGVYIFLGMFLAPYVHLFFSQITPVRRTDEDDPMGARREARKNLLFSDCRAAIVDSFGSQYIVVLSFIIAGFVMRKQISYYHVRMIHALASITLASTSVSEYNRIANSFYVRETTLRRAPGSDSSVPSFELQSSSYSRPAPTFQPAAHNELLYVDVVSEQAENDLGDGEHDEVHGQHSSQSLDEKKKRKWSSAYARLYLCIIFYAAFTIYAGIVEHRDHRFNACLESSHKTHESGWAMYSIITFLAASTSLSSVFALTAAKQSSAVAWITTTVPATALVIYATRSISIMRRTFQPSGALDAESQFGFGQILVFFMILQLVGEFCTALVADFHKLGKDLVLLQPELQLTTFREQFMYFASTFDRILRVLILVKLREPWFRHDRRNYGSRMRMRDDDSWSPGGWYHRVSEAARDRSYSLYEKAKTAAGRFSYLVRRRPFTRAKGPLNRVDTVALESQTEVVQASGSAKTQAEAADREPGSLSRRGTAKGLQPDQDGKSDAESDDSMAITPVVRTNY